MPTSRIGMAWDAVVVTAASIIGGKLSDRTGRRKIFVLTASVVYGVAVFVVAIASSFSGFLVGMASGPCALGCRCQRRKRPAELPMSQEGDAISGRETGEQVRIVVADDQRSVRAGLALMLCLLPGITVVAVAVAGAQTLAAAGQHHPDVVLVDLDMPVLDGIEATRRLTAEHPRTAVVVLTTYADDTSILEALGAGARGYLTKNAGRADIARAIHAAASGLRDTRGAGCAGRPARGGPASSFQKKLSPLTTSVPASPPPGSRSPTRTWHAETPPRPRSAFSPASGVAPLDTARAALTHEA
jgi:DNA-binding NarL/FixJ family response regulator